MSNLSRLSDQNIADPVLRAHYYRNVIDYVNTVDSDLKDYEIKLDESYRPDLVAFRALGDAQLAWLVLLVCEVDDSAESLPVGETIKLPKATWVRRSMREFMDTYGL
ncbi:MULTISPECIES: baseplate wedge protein 53 [unclassified Vibrio]|uniref:baseplate wedge protein 53 n=1 Tax=Vibrio TaxID=662 RepID=UPI00126804BB|nr:MULTISPECIES: baseplate wedge protein 53 [unclassified Vibrio]QFT40096.1 Base plate wedge protein 53 [Vibrio sp. THAF64]QGM37919.1 Base plate wedge protein 53 [Vibrio sp. THAF191d]QGN73500.1 Base plate wedge protein 53 [Vibrio sp. THAF191c]